MNPHAIRTCGDCQHVWNDTCSHYEAWKDIALAVSRPNFDIDWESMPACTDGYKATFNRAAADVGEALYETLRPAMEKLNTWATQGLNERGNK